MEPVQYKFRLQNAYNIDHWAPSVNMAVGKLTFDWNFTYQNSVGSIVDQINLLNALFENQTQANWTAITIYLGNEILDKVGEQV